MRNILLASTAAVCLMLTVPAAHAQTDAKKQDETKKEQVQPSTGAEHQQRAKQNKQGRSTTGQASEEKKDAGKPESTKSESRKDETNKGAPSSSEKKDQNAAAKPGTETDRHAQSEKSKREKSKSAAEQDKKAPSKSTASDSEKKSTASDKTKASESAKPSTAEAPKSSVHKQENASAPSTSPSAKTAPANKAAAGKAETPNSTANSTNPSGTNNNVNTAASKAGQIDPQKKVQISETISRTRDLAPPVRDLGISITVGERVPSHVHLRPLPREIVTIAPEYRDYDYFTTEEDVVIVSPRTHEIVTEIPRDASRARAEISSSSTSVAVSSNASSAGSMPCQVMQRTASGDMQPMNPSRLRETTGAGAGQDHLAVRVQGPNGQEMPEVTLPEKQGRIIAETNGSDCRIIVEPGQADR